MSKTSNKSRYTQLVSWLPSAFKTRAKRSKRKQSRMGYDSKQSNRLVDGFEQQKRNG